MNASERKEFLDYLGREFPGIWDDDDDEPVQAPNDPDFKATLARILSAWQAALQKISDEAFWTGLQAEIENIDRRIAVQLPEQAADLRPFANSEEESVPMNEFGAPLPPRWMLRRD